MTTATPSPGTPGTAAGPRPAAGTVRRPRPRPMTIWRLERLRLVRSPRGLSLAGVYVFFGLLGPVLAKYMKQLTEHMSGNVKVVVPDPTPKDGMLNYLNQTSQTGLIVVVVIAAGALAIDNRRGLATFYRTRCTSVGAIVWPRYLMNAAAAALANLLGTACCWYGTALLLGSVPVGGVFAGLLCGTAYLAFAVAVVAYAGSLARGTLGTIGVSLAFLLALPILGLVGTVHPWLPTTLVNAPVDLLGTGSLADFARALAVTAAATPLLVLLATRRLAAREV